MTTTTTQLLAEIEARGAAVDAAVQRADELDAVEGNYAVVVVPLAVFHATEASALDVPVMTAALQAVEDLCASLDLPPERAWSSAMFARSARAAIATALTPAEDGS